MAEITKELLDFAKKLKVEKGVYLMLSNSKNYGMVVELLPSNLVKTQKMRGIYVSLNKEFANIEKRLRSQLIDTSNIYFIDGITNTTGKPPKADNCTFLSSPGSLTELSLEISKAFNTGKFDFLFLDSLNTLLVYNSLKVTEKFSHYIISKLRGYNIGGIIIILTGEKESEQLIPVITPFCDGCIDVAGA